MHAGHSAAPGPHTSWYPCTGPPCFPLMLRMHPPCLHSYHLAPLLDGFFLLFSSIYIFNLNRHRTMAATTSPSPPRACRCPTQAPATAKTMTTPTPSPHHPPPALVAGPTLPQLPLPRLLHPQQLQPDPHPPKNI